MKWIGQNVYDFISRFRNDVYLESISSGTIASGGNLGLDSNNKIVKATAADGDITGVTAGTGLSGGGTSGAVTLNVDASQTQITAVGTIGTGVWQGTRISSTYLDADTAHLSETQTFTGAKTFSENISVDSVKIEVTNTTTSSTTQGGKLNLISNDGAALGDNHQLGKIGFLAAEDGSGTLRTGASIRAYADAAWSSTVNDTRLEFYTMDGDGTQELSLTLDSDLLATFAGAVTVTGALTGTLATASQPNITTVGTIGTGVWQGTAIASAYLDADTAHYSATRQVTHHMITDDIDSDVIYISLGEIDSEGTSNTGKHLPLIAPTAGKLLKIFLRTSVDYSSETFTWKLYTRNVSASTGGGPSEIGAQSGAGPTNKTMVTYDFTSSLDSGTNAIAAGDKVQISIEAGDGATANGNYFITCMWEWDLS